MGQGCFSKRAGTDGPSDFPELPDDHDHPFIFSREQMERFFGRCGTHGPPGEEVDPLQTVCVQQLMDSMERPPPCAGMTCENLRCHCRIDGFKWMEDYVTQKIFLVSPTVRVVHATDKANNIEVVLKSFNKTALQRKGRSLSRKRVDPMKKALLEIAIMQGLSHEAVVTYHKTINEEENNMLHLVMEFMPGGSSMKFNQELHEYDAMMIACGGLTCENLYCHCRGTAPTEGTALPVFVAHSYFVDALKGLEYLHSCNVVHRDLKPDNLLTSEPFRIGLMAAPRCKIGDFGVSCFVPEDDDNVADTQGTTVFLSPEALTGDPYSSKKADVWALGVSLFCFLFKQLPFSGACPQSLNNSITHDSLQCPPDVDPELHNLLRASWPRMQRAASPLRSSSDTRGCAQMGGIWSSPLRCALRLRR